VGGDRKARVVAVEWDIGADLAHGLNHVGARLHCHFLAVHGHGDQTRVFGRRLGGRAHCSTSPPIMLLVSRVGVRSASSLPSIILGTPARMENPGARTWTL